MSGCAGCCSHFFTPPTNSVHFARLLCHSATLSVFKMSLVSVVCVPCSLLSLCIFPSVSFHRVTWNALLKKKNPKQSMYSRICNLWERTTPGSTRTVSEFTFIQHWGGLFFSVSFFLFFFSNENHLFGPCLCDGFFQHWTRAFSGIFGGESHFWTIVYGFISFFTIEPLRGSRLP